MLRRSDQPRFLLLFLVLLLGAGGIAGCPDDKVGDGVFDVAILSQGGLVPIAYTVRHKDAVNANILVEYRVGNGNYASCTMAAGGDGTTAISSAAEDGVEHTFMWDSVSDLMTHPGENSVRIRVTPFFLGQAAHADDASGTVVGGPAAVNVMPGSDRGTILVSYGLRDGQNRAADVTLEYSVSGAGGPYMACTLGVGGEAPTAQASTLAGVMHTLAWDSPADISALTTMDVILRVTPTFDASTGNAAVSTSFTVDNRYSITDLSTPTTGPGGDIGGYVPMTYTLTDPAGQPLNIRAQYQVDGGTWAICSMGAGGDGNQNVASSTFGETHTYVWHAGKDLPEQTASNVVVRLTPTRGAVNGMPDDTDAFDLDNRCRVYDVATETPGMQSGLVAIEYTLMEGLSTPQPITVEYNENGTGWAPATMGTGGHGVNNLAASPAGATHLYVWNSQADLPDTVTTVEVRITPGQGATGIAGTTDVFDLDNSYKVVNVSTPTSPAGMDVTFTYAIEDAQSRTVDLLAEYQVAGGAWQACTAGVGGDGTTGLTSSPVPGVTHTYVWDSTDIFPTGADVVVRLRPVFGGYPGTGDDSDPFQVDNNFQAVNVVTPASPAAGYIEVGYTLVDPYSRTADIVAEYRTGGGAWNPCDMAPAGGDGDTGLVMSPSPGTDYVYAWNSLPVVATTASDFEVRITPMWNGLAGDPVQTTSFDIDNNGPILDEDACDPIFDPKLDNAEMTFSYMMTPPGCWAVTTVTLKQGATTIGTVFSGNETGSATPLSHTWDGTINGDYVAPGNYTLFIESVGGMTDNISYDIAIVRLGFTEIEAQDNGGDNEFQMVYFRNTSSYAFYATPAIGEYMNGQAAGDVSELDDNNGDPRTPVDVHDNTAVPVMSGASYATNGYNYPLCYIVSTQPLFQVTLGDSATTAAGTSSTCNYPVAGYDLRLVAADATGNWTTAATSLTPGGTVTLTGPALDDESRAELRELTWTFQYRPTGGPAWIDLPGTYTTEHRFFTIIAAPYWAAGASGTQYSGPWVEVADYFDEWRTAHSITTDDQAGVEECIIKGFNGNVQNPPAPGGVGSSQAIEGIVYDCYPMGGDGGATHYYTGGAIRLSYLLNAHALGVYVNCSDVSSSTTAILGMMGVQNPRMLRLGYMSLNAIWGIGCPDYTTNLWGGSHGFSYHHIGTRDNGTTVYDACMWLDEDGYPGSTPGVPGYNVDREWSSYDQLSATNTVTTSLENTPGIQ